MPKVEKRKKRLPKTTTTTTSSTHQRHEKNASSLYSSSIKGKKNSRHCFDCLFDFLSRMTKKVRTRREVVRLGGGVGGTLGALGGAGAEAVAELARDELECAHAAGTGGLSSLGLLTPVDCKKRSMSELCVFFSFSHVWV
jgi:hypothetical protein